MAKAAILAIGSEIVQGDLIDSNSSWISTQLNQCGVDVAYHLSVGDKESDIVDSLSFLESRVDMVFTCGGLGPTVDDLTGKAVAKWLDKKLNFDDSSWERVEDKLKQKNVPIRDRHRDQCWFPEGSEVLQNSIGTAEGFKAQKGSTQVWVFPGPPRELKAIWSDHASFEISKIQSDPILVRRWKVFAAAESEIAEITEPLVDDLTIGFRASFPIVEVKLCYKNSESQKAEPIIEKISTALKSYEIIEEDLDSELESLMMDIPSLSVNDSITHGLLISRLGNLVQNVGIYGKQFRLQTSQAPSDSGLRVEIRNASETQFDFEICQGANSETKTLLIPESYQTSASRRFQFISEYCLLCTINWLKSNRDGK